MFLYRGKAIVGLLPHIRILRSPLYFESLVALLETGNSAQKAAAAAALGSLGDSRCIDTLRQAYFTTHRDPEQVRSAIVSALGEIPTAAAVELLIEIHKAKGTSRRSQSRRFEQIVIALGQLAQQELAEAEAELIRFLSDGEPSLRATAVTELSLGYWHRPNCLSSALIQQIFDLTGDESDDVRLAAKEALISLAKLGCTKAVVLIRQSKKQA